MITHVFRLLPGQDLKKEIQAFAEANGITAGWIITAVGSLRVWNIRFANQSHGSRSEGYFEIISVVGTVSIHGSHLHICLSDETGATIGGHLLEDNIINTTAEIVIGESKNLIFTRETDNTTSYRELAVRNR